MGIIVSSELLPKELNNLVKQYRVNYTLNSMNLTSNYFIFNNNIKIIYHFNPKYIHVFKDDKKIMDITQFHIGNVTKITNLINNNNDNKSNRIST